MSRARSARGAPGGGDGHPVADLLQVLDAVRPGANAGLIMRAYDVASHWHEGQKRLSGDPYITHPLAVAAILAELGTDDQVLCAALLHDTVEDTPYTLAALGAEFGTEVAALVNAVMAIDEVAGGLEASDDAAQTIAATMSADVRALTIKLADRLHNMRTLGHLPLAKRARKSKQTLDVFAPIAQRLGMDAIRAELESLASTALNDRAQTMSGRLVTATTLLLPAATRPRWRAEWLAELQVLPTRRERAKFAAHILLGIPQLAATLHGRATGPTRQ